MRFVVLALSALLLLAGCAEEETPPGGQDRPAELQIGSIVSLSPSTTELVSPLKFHGMFMGRTSECDWPNAAQGAPVVVNGTQVNWEAIAQMQPDLILYDASLYGPSEIERIESLAGKATFAIDVDTLDGYLKQILRLGQLLGRETDASQYADQVASASGTAKAAVGESNPGVTVMQQVADGYYWMPETGLQASIIQESGGTPVGGSGSQFAPVDFEALVTANPDIILTDGDRDAILGDPRLSSLNAVKTEQVFYVSPDYLFRAGGRVDDLITELGNVFASSTR